MIEFIGEIPSSKSLVNRALILEKCFSGFKSHWSSSAQDVLLLNEALKNIRANEFYAGEGGTTFRFLAVYLSSFEGNWSIKASPSLLIRPHDDLFNFLRSQNILFKQTEELFTIESKGWSLDKTLVASVEKTTQVASAVLMTALRFKRPFDIQFNGKLESNYLNLTEGLLRELGLLFLKDKNKIKFNVVDEIDFDYEVEGDWSSAAFLYILAALKGEVQIENIKTSSLQPDSVVLDCLKSSGVSVEGLKVKSDGSEAYSASKINLKESPDLFPVLSAFFAFCNGESHLHGAHQLAFKETNRIDMVNKLLELCGYKTTKLPDGLRVKGEGRKVLDHKPFEFDCSADHRIYMCAYILKSMGYKISILGEDSVKKSFPEFIALKEKYVFSDRS